LDEQLLKQSSASRKSGQLKESDLEVINRLATIVQERETAPFSGYPNLPYINDYSPEYPPVPFHFHQQDPGPAYRNHRSSGSSDSLPSLRDYDREQAEIDPKIKDFEESEKARGDKKAPDSTVKRAKGRDNQGNMNYQSYLDTPAAGPSSNPRQAPPSPSQNMNHANGMNGGAMGMGGMGGFPTPAGHQSDLNHIMGMVEELSRQLNHNQQLTANVVDKIGKVREKASTMDLTNDELIALVSKELNGKYISLCKLLQNANIGCRGHRKPGEGVCRVTQEVREVRPRQGRKLEASYSRLQHPLRPPREDT
jgi:Asp-tRNA(Asn)/Glu-tRNA(Gln) amidotransferase C subunit